MQEKFSWMDLYIKDFGGSQIEDKKELAQAQKKMKTFYQEFLIPLYKPVQKSKKFKFSVPEDELTCRIMFEDLKEYHKLNSVSDILYKIAENRPNLTEEKIKKLLTAMQKKKEVAEEPKKK